MPVLDANLLVVLVSGDPRRLSVLQQITRWLDEGVSLHTPLLAQYEIANALTRLVVSGAFPSDKLEEAVSNILVLPLSYHSNVDIPSSRRNSEDAWSPERLRCGVHLPGRVAGL